MAGIYAVIVSIVLLVGSYLIGRTSSKKETTQKLKIQIADAEQRAAKAETETQAIQQASDIAREATAESDAIKQYFVEFEEKRTEAESTGNIDEAIEAAKKLAERASAWRNRNENK